MIDFERLVGFDDRQTDRQTNLTDIGGCRVAFATENLPRL